MLSMRATPFAILLELYFARDEFAVFARPVVNSVALGTRYSYELVL